jgi:hypothetical protein
MPSNTNKRSALLRGLFGRPLSKKRATIVKQPQQETKKRIITGGDQVKLSSTKIIHIEHPGNTNNEMQFSFPGLQYDFKQMKSRSNINSSEIKQSSKGNSKPS